MRWSAGLVGAEARARPDLRVVAAGVRALFIDRAAAGLRVQIAAIAVRALRERKDAVLEIEMADDAGFLQFFRDLLRRFAGFEFIDHAHAHEVGELDLDRHRAAGRAAGVAQAGAILEPASQAVEVGVVNQRFFHGSSSGKTRIVPVPAIDKNNPRPRKNQFHIDNYSHYAAIVNHDPPGAPS